VKEKVGIIDKLLSKSSNGLLKHGTAMETDKLQATLGPRTRHDEAARLKQKVNKNEGTCARKWIVESQRDGKGHTTPCCQG